MNENAVPQDEILTIDIHIEEVALETSTYLVWYYNNMSARSFGLRVQNRYRQFQFKMDAETAMRFAFETPELERFSDGDLTYEDLDYAYHTDDCVVFTDSQEHWNHATVGRITLVARPLGDPLHGTNAYDQDSLASDPEVTNTGSNNGCPSPR